MFQCFEIHWKEMTQMVQSKVKKKEVRKKEEKKKGKKSFHKESNHPPSYTTMIKSACAALQSNVVSNNGPSRQTIAKYLLKNFKVSEKHLMDETLAKMVDSKELKFTVNGDGIEFYKLNLNA